MRGVALNASAAVLVASLLIAPVVAQDELLLSATLTTTLVIPITDIDDVRTESRLVDEVPADVSCYNGAGSTGSPGSGVTLTLEPGSGFIRFRTDESATGCREARFVTVVPTDAQRATVTFGAEREVLASPGIDPTPMHQELRFFDGAAPIAQIPYFQPGAPSSDATAEFSEHVELTSGQERLGIGWFFWDEGTNLIGETGLATSRAGFVGTVSAPTLRWDGIPVVAESQERNIVDSRGSEVIEEARIDFVLPNDRDGLVSLNVEVPVAWAVAGLVTPLQEEVSPDQMLITSVGGLRQVQVGHDITEAGGAGVYTLVIQRSTSLSTQPAMVPLFLSLAFVPAAAGALAGREIGVFRRRAVGEFARTARLARFAVGVIAAGYVFVLIWAIAGPGWVAMTAWPVRLEAGIVLASFGVTAVAFLAVGYLWKLQMTRLMENTIDEQARINRELERSNNELEQFAYVASHDLQEPLRAVYGYAQLLRDEYKGRLGDDGDEYLGFVLRGADRMSALVTDLLQYSRVDRSQGRHVLVETNELLDEVRRDLAGPIKEAKAKLQVGHLPPVYGDPILLRQLWQNLIQNAIKFTRKDTAPDIKVALEGTEDGMAVFKVADNGIGVADEDKHKIFVIFQRLHPPDEYPGTGIGLALCRKIVERHGGTIRLEDTPGGGATFIFTLPLEDEGRGGDD